MSIISRFTSTILNRNHHCAVLYFHRIVEDDELIFSHDLTRSEFSKLIRVLKYFFDIKTPIDWLCGRISRDKPTIMISFDDGYKDNLIAAQVMELHGVNGTFFISTVGPERYGAPEALWQNRIIAHYQHKMRYESPELSTIIAAECLDVLSKMKYMDTITVDEHVSTLDGFDYQGLSLLTADDIKKLSKKGHAIGLHTHNHRILTSLNEHDAFKELEQSKAFAIDHLDINDHLFMAYPNGSPGKDFTLAHQIMAKELGFLCAFSTSDAGFSRSHESTRKESLDIYSLPRFLPHRKGAFLRAISAMKIAGET